LINKNKKNWIDVEWSSVGSVSGPGEKEVLKTVVYEKNPPIIFNPKASVKLLDVRIMSIRSQDEELLHNLLQKTKQS
jgi:hypothetical protein